MRIEEEQRGADDRLNAAQRRLFEARDAMQAQARRTAEAKAGHAALTERVTALAADIRRLEDAGRELETRVTTRRDELQRTQERREQLREAIVTAEATLDADLRAFDDLRQNVRTAEERCLDAARHVRARRSHGSRRRAAPSKPCVPRPLSSTWRARRPKRT